MSNLIVKAQAEKKNGRLVAVASTNVEDRHGEVVDNAGWVLNNYKKNPVMLWAHDHSLPAIGTAKNIRVTKSSGAPQLVFEPQFHDLTPEAAAIKAMFEGYTDSEGVDHAPILNSFSVGFRPVDTDGNTYTKSELLEISAVNVPANPEARVMAYKSLEEAGFEKDVIKSVVGVVDTPDQANDSEDKYEALMQEINALKDEVKALRGQSSKSNDAANPETRMHQLKTVDKLSSTLLREQMTDKQRILVKAIDKVTEKLLIDTKQEIKQNGSN